MRRFPVLMIIVIFISILTLSGVLPVTLKPDTPLFKDADGMILPDSIAEERRVTLGGYEQYLLIRSRDRGLPVLLFLHGGPGTPETALFRHYNSDLEENFVVVHWEQRGSGKSFSKDLDPGTLTIPQMLSDLDELVDYLRKEFRKETILLMGHSWGTGLGIAYAAEHPEKITAYIGICQKSDVGESEAEGYRWVLDQARARNDKRAVRKLLSIGPPPYSLDSTGIQRKYLWKYGGAFYEPRSFFSIILLSLGEAETSIPDLWNYLKGQKVSLQKMWPEITCLDMNELYPEVRVPVYFFLGKHDRQVSADLAEEYYNRLQAPRKELVRFEQSAHNPPYEEPERFNGEVLRIGRELSLWK